MRILNYSRSLLLIAFLSVWLVNPAGAATFTVDTLGDYSDNDPGDGDCEAIIGNFETGFIFVCSLRSAIQEANALAGHDIIEFEVAGTIKPTSAELPTITEAVTIDGSTAPGAPSRDFELLAMLRSAPVPAIFIDGSNTPGLVNGLYLGSGARGSAVYNIGVTNFFSAGIRISVAAGAEETIISGNWLGIDANRSAAANGTGINLGIIAGVVNIRIGYEVDLLEANGRGNVLSGNRIEGLRGTASGVTVRGNWIGSDGGGMLTEANYTQVGMIPNGGSGVQLIGDGNALIENQVLGNGQPQILSNGHPQVVVKGSGTQVSFNDIFGVTVDIANSPDWTSITPSSSDGLHVFGPAAEIMNNDVWANQNGIVLDSLVDGVADSGGELTGNTAMGNALDGIVVAGVNGVTLDDNEMYLNGNYGARLTSDDNLIRGNSFGLALSEALTFGNESGGLIIYGGQNEVSNLPGEGISFDVPNNIAFNSGPGITVLGSGAQLEDCIIYNNASAGILLDSASETVINGNSISLNASAGVLLDSALATVINGNHIVDTQKTTGNDGNAIRLVGASNGAQISGNIFQQNEGAVVLLDTGAGEEHLVWRNAFLKSYDIPIDLDGDGVTSNDPNDDDNGANRLQNFPVLSNLSFDADAEPPTVTVDVMVDTTEVNSSLPLTIEFYYSAGAFDRGGVSAHVGTPPLNPLFSYANPSTLETAVIELPDSFKGGAIKAIAIDNVGNTSEFSAAMEFGEIDDFLFADGFEENEIP